MATIAPGLAEPDLIDEELAEPVALVSWPDEATRRSELAASGRPRLLLIDADDPPPIVWDDGEDWVRLPAPRDELVARAANLLRFAPPRRTLPVLDTDGLLRSGRDWVAVPPLEARLLARLLHRPGQVVPKEELLEAGWPEGTDDPNILHGRIRLLRGRIESMGVRIENIRGVGFLLEVD